MKAAGQYFPVKLVKVVITLASVNEVLNEIYEVTVLFLNEIYEGTVLFDTECQMKFGNIKFKLSSWWSDITLEKLTWMASFKLWSCKFAEDEKFFFHFQFVANFY